jgi:prepilin-type N-terminal cleavage/methylation domain-containing protein
MNLSLQKKNGFTLVELMIVAIVLAILVATVVVAQKTTIIKSKNTRIFTSISESKKIAEKIYMQDNTGYTSFCYSEHLNMSSEELRILEQDIKEVEGITRCFATQNSYCLEVKLFDGSYFCTDDEGHSVLNTSQKCVDGNTTCNS